MIIGILDCILRGFMSNANGNKTQSIYYGSLSWIECPECSRLIIPRVVYYSGTVVKTVCPFCVSSIWTAKKGWIERCIERIAFTVASLIISMLFIVFIVDIINRFR